MWRKGLIGLIVTLGLVGCGENDNITSVKEGVLKLNKTLTVGQALDNWNNCKETTWTHFETDNGVNVVEAKCVENDKLTELLSTFKNLKEKEVTQAEINQLQKQFNFYPIYDEDKKNNTLDYKNPGKYTDMSQWYGFGNELSDAIIQSLDDSSERYNSSLNVKIKSYEEYNKNLTTLKENACLNVDYISNEFQFTVNKDSSFQTDNVQYTINWADGKKFSIPQNQFARLKIVYQNIIDESWKIKDDLDSYRKVTLLCSYYSKAK